MYYQHDLLKHLIHLSSAYESYIFKTRKKYTVYNNMIVKDISIDVPTLFASKRDKNCVISILKFYETIETVCVISSKQTGYVGF